MNEDKRKKVKDAQQRIIQEMKGNRGFIAYFEPYKESDVDSFIDGYADLMATLEVYGDFTKYRQERIIEDYINTAWIAIKLIQYKKLFDLECQWRAEQLTSVQDVLVTKDFKRVADDILNYTGVPPVSPEDIELYQQFLLQKPNYIIYCSGYHPYPYYEDVKDMYREEHETDVEYFDFHNNHTGLHSLLLLPDVRGMKELRYIDAAFEAIKKEIKETKSAPEEKKYLHHSDDEMIRFGDHFGDKKTVNYIKDRKRWMSEKPDMVFSWAFDYLSTVCPEVVPIESNHDWKEGLYYAAVMHQNQKVSDLLPSVHETYLMQKEIGILSPKKDKISDFDLSKMWKERILQGRKISGEPEDFNF